MAYVRPKFDTKEAFVDAVNNGQSIVLESEWPTANEIPANGEIIVRSWPYGFLRWWAKVTLKDGLIVSVE